jgi:hypothetical protein
MMNRFFTLILLFAAFTCSAQHTATVSAQSDFSTIQNGKIESTFTLDHELSANELANFNEWVNDNASLMTITKNGLEIKAIMSPDYNDRKVYMKLFGMMGVDKFNVNSNGSLTLMEMNQFFEHFNL